MPKETFQSGSKALSRSFYIRPTVTVAKDLLGKKLVRVIDGHRLSGIIVEVEAYLGTKDAAAHTFGGRRTPRNETMYGEGGYAYVYFIYGMHFCLNVVTRCQGQPEAVLIRALEPVEGIDLMKSFRKTKRDRNLTNGPAKLCQALNITRRENGLDLVPPNKNILGPSLFLEAGGIKRFKGDLVTTTRVGVEYAQKAAGWPLRFYLRGNPYVSVK